MPNVEITRSFGKVTPEEIARFERDHDVELHPSHRDLLLRSNGGSPEPAGIRVPGWYGKMTAVNWIYGIHGGKNANLGKVVDGSKDLLPDGFVPLADDPGGNLFVIGTTGEHAGQVYLWDHEDYLDEYGRPRRDMGNMYKVADTLDELLDRLEDG